ncbi:hypothetical protein [Phreatobacter oligotrophus]|jgi:hypothetical protein|uniref:Uncharacterized protein n=1 Tax=Phreatobacter oligotrophus TaxID=1122261 RepID=A0A2T4YP28_9HYPH|nr:hypothetical protein [Phreatobacter oligotrophus]PTM45158.1 hypothetical protein C8P69_1331 [Phreatobacter oligotrophus]
MFGMAVNSAKLFFAGKLFKDNPTVVRLLLTGFGAGAAAGIAVGLVAPIWIAVPVAGAVAGFLQPILLKDVKYN